jgi:hypothetical protein
MTLLASERGGLKSKGRFSKTERRFSKTKRRIDEDERVAFDCPSDVLAVKEAFSRREAASTNRNVASSVQDCRVLDRRSDVIDSRRRLLKTERGAHETECRFPDSSVDVIDSERLFFDEKERRRVQEDTFTIHTQSLSI